MGAGARLHFKPWIGKNYHKGFNGDGIKLLILGESHYQDSSSTATIRWIQEHIRGNPSRAFSGMQKIVTGADLTPEQVAAFWNSIAFANFVQTAVTDKWERPVRMDFEAARPTVLSLLREVAPDLMIVFGRAVWCHLPDEGDPGFAGSQSAELAEGHYAYWYCWDGQKTLAASINHPRSTGRTFVVWHDWVLRLLSEAGRKKCQP